VFPDGSICDEWAFFREECAPEDAQEIAQRVDASAMWQPGMGFMQTMRANCTTFTNPEFGRCFAAQMQTHGAPPAAVQFTERLQSRSSGQIGYLRDFRDSGQVDIAYVNYPLRANTNQGWLLVNGKPDFLDVDNQDLLPASEAHRAPPLAVLIQAYPQAALWPGDRSGTRRPAAEERPDGGQLFVVDYYVLNGCHACERLGSARFGFRFDRFGRFLGARFLGLTTTATLQ
jgi:hypothetical protein